MEYVFNHSLSQQDTSGAPDRRVRPQRPQSAFIPTTSYYAQREDDVGKPVLQHRPLAKGEHTQASLAKVWDDPAQRPKQFLSNDVNKVSYALMSRDIEGAVSRSAEVPQRPRDTNPCAPTYILPGHTANAAATAAAMAASSQPAGNSPSGRPPPGPSAPSATTSGGGAPPATTASPTAAGASPGRSSAWQDVSDITAVASVVERPARLGTRHTNFSTADIEGAWPHWEPPFRAHVGRNLRDPGLDVSDITGAGGGGEGGIRGAGARRRAASARTARDYGTSRDYGAFYHAPPDQTGDAPRQTYVPPAEAPHPYSPQQQQTAAPTTYLPPPLSWQPVEPPQPSSTAPSGPAGPTGTWAEGEGGGSPASGASPRGPPPAAHSLLLRSASSSGPPYATHIPGGGLAATLAASLGLAPADRAVAAAELPAATVGRPSPARSDPALRHSIKRAASEAQRAAGADAARLVAGLRPSREAVEAFWGACRRLDREVCGKLPPSDFAAALRATGVLPASSGPDGGASTAAALAAGLADGSGLVSYRGLARSLLAQAPQPPPAAPPPAARPRPFSAGPGVGVGARSGSAPRTARVQSARPAGPAQAQYGGGEGGRSLLDGPGSTSAGRRSVNWAPELSSMAGCGQGQGQAAAPGYQEQQARPHTPPQLQQEPQRQPAGPSTVTARIHLGGGGAGASPGQTAGGNGAVSSAPSPPPEREWRPPTPPHASHHPTPPAPQPPAPHATSAPHPGVLPGAGAGPNWPPAPPPDPYQKRPSSAIALSCGGTPPREAADTTFFPFKATPYWFGGSTVGAAGGGDMAGPGGPGEAARAYQPSGDHTAGLVGRGHLRSTLPGANSVCVDPAQEAAILGRTGSGLGGSSRGRPASALGGSGAGSTAMYRQLHQEGPPLYSAAVDPAAATGSSLKGPAAAAFAAMRTQPSGPRMTGAPRPVSAPRASTARASSARAGAGGGGGGSCVGSRALEASMLRETIAAVRSLY
ncbi:hypothetical protein HYH03_012306 [Edaphochlamys debaryana]|uniref:Uncharacterized protein n=1 Tax=Edaphochlamys debaryana TaxID=47281 RepID=A0A835XSI5_9CHLO|nr:hypothetical protein HYH03_012306 [Edaphochlamys debaryana]|eukprot:KAG2489286.1 hypothetical protein HYH03_012306 [Edaphochlamys debaryana]